MLTLNRKEGERVRITVPPSNEVTYVWVSLLESRTYRSKIGFDAPKKVGIVRQEVIVEGDGPLAPEGK